MVSKLYPMKMTELLKWSQPWFLCFFGADFQDLVEADLVSLPHLFAARDDLGNKMLLRAFTILS